MVRLANLLILGCVLTIVATGVAYAGDMGSISSGQTQSADLAPGEDPRVPGTAGRGIHHDAPVPVHLHARE